MARPIHLLLGCMLVLMLSASCASTRVPPTQDPAGTSPVSEVPPMLDEFRHVDPPLERMRPVKSSGDCAPRYRKGRVTGTCINGEPCRGFGVLEHGKAVCMCYARRGGCNEGERCDPRGAQCVPEDEHPTERAR